MKKNFVITIAFAVGLMPISGFCESPFIVDKSRGEWTLFVIPDTQGYAEDWRDENSQGSFELVQKDPLTP